MHKQSWYSIGLLVSMVKADDQIPTSYHPKVKPMQHHCTNNFFFLPKKQNFFSYQAGFKHITSIKSGKSYLPRGMRIHTPLKLPSGCMDRPSGLSEHGPAYPKKAQQAHLSLGTKNIYCTLSRSSPPLNTALCPLHCPQRWKRRPSGRPRASAHCRPPPESKCLMPVRILCQPFANPPQASSPNSSP